MNTGESHAWERLKSLASEDVCSRTGATFDREGNAYSLGLYNQRIGVSLGTGEICGTTPEADHLLNALSYFSRLSVLSFLIHAKDVPPSGNLVKPAEMPGMEAMVRGSHTLPLHKLTARYAGDLKAFLERGKTYGGIPQDYGDASLLLHPFEVLPVVLIIRAGDEEFPANSSLLLDTTSRFQAPPDILWCIMMLSVLLMM
ncbi:MAG: DUF3786 domain-containing protein [Kiritimatiellia bacterium]|jgi:hypothetical protein|nr:DUF3786 domain-containing protein [Kiritimatiellia bacterium]